MEGSMVYVRAMQERGAADSSELGFHCRYAGVDPSGDLRIFSCYSQQVRTRSSQVDHRPCILDQEEH